MRVDLDFDLDQMTDDRRRAFQRGADAAGDRDMIVLDQHRVVEAEAVIEAAAAAHRIFLQGAQPRRGLAGADQAGVGAFQLVDQRSCRGGDAGQMAGEIQRGAFGCEHRARIAGDRHQRGLLGNGVAVARMRDDLCVRREPAHDGFDQRQAGDAAGGTRHHDGTRLRILRHGRDRGDVAGAAEVFGERTRHRVVDLERRDEGVGAIERRRRSRDIEAAHGIEHRVDP